MIQRIFSNIDYWHFPKRVLCFIAIICLPTLFATNPAYSLERIARVNDANGLPEVLFGGKEIIKSVYVNFGIDTNDKWTWVHQKNDFQVLSNYQYQNIAENQEFAYTLKNRIFKKDDNTINYLFEFDVLKDTPRVIGGGIEFSLDPSHNKFLGKPRLLPGNTGWVWGDLKKDFIKFQFNQPIKKLYFEKGNANKIRAFFFVDSIRKSVQIYEGQLSFSSSTRISPTLTENFGYADLENWFKYDDPYVSPVDLSFLNSKPAGKHGFLRANGEDLVFEDGKPERFWGTNISAGALFSTSMIDIPKHAKRIAALGFNLVRIHHHDSRWVNPNVFGKNAKTTQNLDEKYMAYIDKWIAELNEQGIYIWFDLHVQRFVTKDDEITAFDEIEKKSPKQPGRANIKGYAYVNSSIRKAMKDVNRKFLTRVNKITGQKYSQNPGIAFLLLTNENDVTHHFGNILLRPHKVPYHTKKYLAKAKAFAALWKLPAEKVWRSWEPGPSKIFLNDLEHRFNTEIISSLREYDKNHLISTTNTWGNNPLYSLPALSDGDVIDVHTYGRVGALEKNPNIVPNFTHWIASAQVANKPLAITEWNLEKFPVPDRHLSPMLAGAMGAHQGWDAILQFGYTAEPPRKKGRAFNYAMYNDPAFLGLMPAAALMYRAGHVKGAKKRYLLALDKSDFFYKRISPETSSAIRTISEKGKLQIALPETEELPWLKAAMIGDDSILIRDPDLSVIESDATYVVSDTGELTRDWERGIYVVDTPKTKAAIGWIGGEVIKLGDIEFEIETLSASVAIQALDDNLLVNSKNIMISLAARAIPLKKFKAPILAEPVIGVIKLKAPPGLKLYKRSSFAKFLELPMAYIDGVYNISLTSDLRTYWLFLSDSSPETFS